MAFSILNKIHISIREAIFLLMESNLYINKRFLRRSYLLRNKLYLQNIQNVEVPLKHYTANFCMRYGSYFQCFMPK